MTEKTSQLQQSKNEVVVSLGGSTIIKEGIDIKFIVSFSNLFKKYVERGAIVVGGGKIARDYIKAIDSLEGKEIDKDYVAIMITRANAYVINSFIEGKFVKSPEEAYGSKYYVSGGFFPGLTTDSCSVLLAEKLGIKKVINISNVEGIYDKDPSKYKEVKKFDKLSYEEFEELANKSDERKAGTHFVFDLLAIKLAKRAKIKEIHFVGKNLEEIGKALKGEKHNGTVVLEKL